MFVKHTSGIFQLIITQIIHLISILVDTYTSISVICASALDFQQCGMCDQQSLISAFAYGQSVQSLC